MVSFWSPPSPVTKYIPSFDGKYRLFLPAAYHYNEDIPNKDRPILDADMFELADMGRLLIIIGVFLIIFGLVFTFWSRIPFLGHLPGDFSFQRGGVSFFFPLMTSLVISLILTVILNIVFRFFR
jgi:hypothetical protein